MDLILHFWDKSKDRRAEQNTQPHTVQVFVIFLKSQGGGEKARHIAGAVEAQITPAAPYQGGVQLGSGHGRALLHEQENCF